MSVEAILHGLSYTRPQEDALLAEKQDSKVLTLAEYNALPAADKAKDIVYFITDDIVGDFNNYVSLMNVLGKIVIGKLSTSNININEYVFVTKSSITGIVDGIYKASKIISANTDLDSTYFSAIEDGVLNNLRNNTLPLLSSITLSENWNGEDPYTLVVTISNKTITNNTKIDLLPTMGLLNTLKENGITALYIENNNGILTAIALGGTISESITIQCILYEVMI